MKMKIVADSSANLLSLPDIDFGVVPLHIIVGENDYIDDDKIDLTAMQENLSSYKGKTSTSAQVLTNGRMRLAMPMLSFVSPLQVPYPVHITVLLSLRTSMNTIIPAERYMF